MKGVSFGSIHSYEDLNLILEPFTPTPAEPQTNFLQVPGRNGYLDLTEANGEIKYKSREFLIPFTIAPWDNQSFDNRVMNVSNLLNGKRCNITFDRDPNYYWVGRLSVDKYAQNKNIGQIVIKATVDPYKLLHEETLVQLTLSSEEQTETLHGSKMPVVPEIICTANDAYIIFNGVTYQLQRGKQKISGIRFVDGPNNITYASTSGSGSIVIRWQKGCL